MKLSEVDTPEQKAGLIPYYRDGDELRMLFMISSDAKYGGALPQLAKGGVDPGESVQQAAIREAQEELGLRAGNMLRHTLTGVWSGEVRGTWQGKPNIYELSVYMVEVLDPDDFDEPHYETERTVWMTPAEFAKSGRRSQNNIVQLAAAKLAQ